MRGAAKGERRGGRGKGALNKRSQEIAQKAAQEGITPIEVMLDAMRKAHSEGREAEAVSYAASAAPYIHPKLQAINKAGGDEQKIVVELGAEALKVIKDDFTRKYSIGS